MGAGNFLPPQDQVYPHIVEEQLIKCDPVYEMVYVESTYFDLVEDDIDEYYDKQERFERKLLEDIDGLLPGSFWRFNNDGEKDMEAQNCVLKVVLAKEYDTYYPLLVTPRSPLGLKHIEQVSKKLFDGLVEKGYKLSVRTCAYTRGEYQKFPAMETVQEGTNG